MTRADAQVAALVSLLKIWPQCSKKNVEQYIQDTMGVVMTRSCLQEAKDILGLHKSEHSENTEQKQKYARYIILVNVCHYGVGGLKKSQFISRVAAALKEKYGQNTNQRLMHLWVDEYIQEFALTDIDTLPKLLEESKLEVASFTREKEDTENLL